MKLLAAISSLIAVFLMLLLLFGISLSDQTEIVEVIQIEAPVPVVWNTIIRFDEHSKWQKSIKSLYNYNNSARQVYYEFAENTILVNQQVRVRESAWAIDYFQIGSEQFTGFGGFSGQIILTLLADGSTEMRWKIMYSANEISQRILNYFLIENKFKTLLKNNLTSIKSYIED